MPANIFHSLANDKKNKIIEASIHEFAEYGYSNSSTNRIVKNAGISKGSLFQYFGGKEDLYFYILDHVTEELTTDLDKEALKLPTDIFRRVARYAELEISWYILHPAKYRIILNAFTPDNTDLYRRISARYSQTMEELYNKQWEALDTSSLNFDKTKILTLLKWVLKGFNEDFLNRLNPKDDADLEIMKIKYIKGLTEYLDILKSGFLAK